MLNWKNIIHQSLLSGCQDIDRKIKQIQGAVWIIAALSAGIALWRGAYADLAGCWFLVLFAAVLGRKSRLAAVILSFYSMTILFSSIHSLIGIGFHPLILFAGLIGLVLVWICVDAVKITLQYHLRMRTELVMGHFIILNVAALVYTVIFSVVFFLTWAAVDQNPDSLIGSFYFVFVMTAYVAALGGKLPFTGGRPLVISHESRSAAAA